jgi:hypothetical protein
VRLYWKQSEEKHTRHGFPSSMLSKESISDFLSSPQQALRQARLPEYPRIYDD